MGFGTFDFPGLVGIFDAQDELSAGLPGNEPGVQRGTDAADM
jgi:hypothetical protein